MKKLEEALAATKKSLLLDKWNPDTWSLRGFCFYRLGKFDEALQCYDNALKINSKHLIKLKN